MVLVNKHRTTGLIIYSHILFEENVIAFYKLEVKSIEKPLQ